MRSALRGRTGGTSAELFLQAGVGAQAQLRCWTIEASSIAAQI
jgi:hypothetical protein